MGNQIKPNIREETRMDREQAIKEYGMSDDFVQAMVNSDGTVDMAVTMWTKDAISLQERCEAKKDAGMSEYDAWKEIIVEGSPQPKVQESPLERANRVSVQSSSISDAWKAVFWRTHKKIKEVLSRETKFDISALKDMNGTAKREAFRSWICEHAEEYGIKYDPKDNRKPTSAFPSKYTSDELVQEWSQKIVAQDMQEWTTKIADEYKAILAIKAIQAEQPVPVTERNSKEVSPKYGNGNWAYATVPVTATIEVIEGENTNEGYVTMAVELVSGQMKKPAIIGGNKYNYTSFKEELLKDIKEFLPAKEDAKAPKDKSPKGKKDKQTPSNSDKSAEKVTEKPEPKKRGRKKKSDSDPKTPKNPDTGVRKITSSEKKRIAKKTTTDEQ